LTAFTQDVIVKCYGADGRMVLNKTMSVNEDRMIDFSQMQQGVYVISVQSGKWNETIKIIK